MSTLNSKRVRLVKLTGILFVAYLLAGFAFSDTAPTQAATITNAEQKRLGTWYETMRKISLPGAGCYTATYPATEWKETDCMVAPLIPMIPRTGPRPLTIGAGDDISAQTPGGFISQGIGSFDSVAGVTSASSSINNVGLPVENAYSLQLNTDFFASTACAGSPNPGCQGWEQFIFYNDGAAGSTFIQYWLIRYNDPCPAGWIQFAFPGSPDIYCYRNSGSVGVPNQPIGNLGNLVLTGTVASGSDSVSFSAGGPTIYSTAGIDAVNAAAGWTVAEFNIFGAGGGSELAFNNGTTIVPRTRIFYGGNAAPICTAQGFTGETNNLSFGPGAPASSPPGPAVFFTESSAGGAFPNCAAATTIGDTHLHTLGGLFYDFQAYGDFILAQTDTDFVVQARQVSGAPTWPDTSVNNAVATQMGDTKVAVCLNPDRRLVIDGVVTPLNDGESFLSADGVTVWRKGNVYTIISESGNAVRATVNNTWINANVGIGRWPSNVTGLLANVGGNVNQIATRDGVVLTAPFSFEDLYHRYADSWRVPVGQSLLSACNADLVMAEKIEMGAPEKPFYAENLDPVLYQNARAACTEAGVAEGALLDACILDVTVIGDEAAAEAFTDMPEPNAVGLVSLDVKPTISKLNCSWLLKILWLLLIIILLLLLIIYYIISRCRKTPTPPGPGV